MARSSPLPEFPIYIVSKGRWKTRFTMKALDKIGVPYFVVVEAQEVDAYAAHIDRARLLVLDPAYQRDYETCDDLGDSKSKGPGPARNFAWDHSIAAGQPWHWVMDDNIIFFGRFNRNLKVPVSDGSIFVAMESFAQRYVNVGMLGPNYFMFVSRKSLLAPFILNTRIYSCNLIRNDLGIRWRGRYNEDTDLSLRLLKAGWCTVQFNAFVQRKLPTQTIRGGNTDAFYLHEGTRPKSEMLVRLHPDVARIVYRFKRCHHFVDYSVFKHGLVRKPGLILESGVDNFGMSLYSVPPSRNYRGPTCQV